MYTPQKHNLKVATINIIITIDHILMKGVAGSDELTKKRENIGLKFICWTESPHEG